MALKINSNNVEPTDNAVGYDVTLGVFSSSTAGYGNKLTSSKTKTLDVCVDDGGAVIGATAVRGVRERLLLTAAQTGDFTGAAGQRQTKITSDCSGATGHVAGGWDYLELVSGAKPGVLASATFAMADAPSGATIPSGGVLACLSTGSNSLAGTHTGKAVAINFEAPLAGNFDYLFQIPASAGLGVANTKALTAQSAPLCAVLPVRFGTTNGWIPVLSAIPTA